MVGPRPKGWEGEGSPPGKSQDSSAATDTRAAKITNWTGPKHLPSFQPGHSFAGVCRWGLEAPSSWVFLVPFLRPPHWRCSGIWQARYSPFHLSFLRRWGCSLPTRSAHRALGSSRPDAGGGPSCGAASARALGTQFEDNIFYSFGGVPDGGQPLAGLFESDDGSYWGTTSQGGTTNSASGCGSGCGMVFQVALVHNFNHSFYKYTQIADFTGYSNADGSTPVTALAADATVRFTALPRPAAPAAKETIKALAVAADDLPSALGIAIHTIQ